MSASIPITVPVASGIIQASTGPQALRGFSLYCTTASRCNIREKDASGKIICVIAIPAATAMGDHFNDGVFCHGDMYLEWVVEGGDAVGAIWVT